MFLRPLRPRFRFFCCPDLIWFCTLHLSAAREQAPHVLNHSQARADFCPEARPAAAAAAFQCLSWSRFGFAILPASRLANRRRAKTPGAWPCASPSARWNLTASPNLSKRNILGSTRPKIRISGPGGGPRPHGRDLQDRAAWLPIPDQPVRRARRRIRIARRRFRRREARTTQDERVRER